MFAIQDPFSLGSYEYYTISHMRKMILYNIMMICRKIPAKILAETWKCVHKRKIFAISVHNRIFYVVIQSYFPGAVAPEIRPIPACYEIHGML